MKKKKTYKKILFCIISFIFLTFLILLACQSPETSSGGGSSGGGDDDDLEITITRVGWVIENIPTTFWTSNAPSSTCFYNWFVYYEGDDISLSDIQSARIYTTNGYWNLIPTSNFFDGTNKMIGGWARNCWKDDHIVPIGAFRVEIVLTNGYTAPPYNTTFPAPGDTVTNGNNYVYTEDYTPLPAPSDYTPMIKRATILPGYTIDDTTKEITIEFNVDDTLVYNGLVCLFDSSGYEIGYTGYFRNFETGDLDTALIDQLNNTGAPNTNTINISDIDNEINYHTGKTFNDIDEFMIILTDGKQYEFQSASYDCRSFTERTTFTP